MEIAAYQAQDSALTLAEGLQEYFELNPGLTMVSPDTPEAELFLPHDATHVLFGTSTSLVEEAMTDVWTLAGADVGVLEYGKLMRHAAKLNPGKILNQIGYRVVARDMILSCGPMLQAYRRGRRMRKKWPFRGYVEFMDRPLAELRREFGIEVYLPRPALREASAVRGAAC